MVETPNWPSAPPLQESRKKGHVQTMPLAWWLVAWDRYALAAQETEQFTMQESMRYKEIIIKIAASAGESGRTEEMGVLYDQVARKMWEEESGRTRGTFNVREEMIKCNEEAFRRTQNLYAALKQKETITGSGQKPKEQGSDGAKAAQQNSRKRAGEDLSVAQKKPR